MFRLVLAVCLVLAFLSCMAQSDSGYTIVFTSNSKNNFSPHCEVLPDSNGQLRFENVTDSTHQKQFRAFDRLFDVKDFTGWFRMRFRNGRDARISYMLLFFQFGDSIQIHEVTDSRINHYLSGYLIPYSQ